MKSLKKFSEFKNQSISDLKKMNETRGGWDFSFFKDLSISWETGTTIVCDGNDNCSQVEYSKAWDMCYNGG
jgi:hypothetical protein